MVNCVHLLKGLILTRTPFSNMWQVRHPSYQDLSVKYAITKEGRNDTESVNMDVRVEMESVFGAARGD